MNRQSAGKFPIMNIDKLINDYKTLKSLRLTAKINNISRTKVTSLLKNCDVEIGKSYADLKKSINSSYFSSIDTDDKAYWLGFIYADGYIDEKAYKLRIELQASDKDHLIKFVKALGGDVSIVRYRKSRDTYRITIADKRLIQDLISCGVRQAKSLTLTYPTNLQQNLTKSFIRGYFDGDGSVYGIGKKGVGMSIISTQEVCESLKRTIRVELDIIGSTRSVGTKNVWRYEVTKTTNALKVCDWLYSGSSVHLDRKINKYILLKERTSTTTIDQP